MTAPATARPTDDQITALVRDSNPNGIPGYWTREELARKLCKSLRTLDRMHAAGKGPARIAVGGGAGIRASLVLYRIDAVLAWLNDQEIGPVRTRTRRSSMRSNA